MKTFLLILFVGMATAVSAGWFPPADYPWQTDECNARFGRHGSGRYACGRSVDICKSTFGLTGQAYQDCQEAVLLFYGIREADYQL